MEPCQTLIVEIRELETREQVILTRFDPNHPSNDNLPPLSTSERLQLTQELNEIRAALREKRAAERTCYFELNMHSIRVSDANGSGRANITVGQISTWVNRTNGILEPARIRLLFNASETGPDFEDMQSDLLIRLNNRDEEAENEARRVAGLYPGKLVVFFRNTMSPDTSAGCGPGCGYSGRGYRYIVMPDWQTLVCGRHNDSLLAHEFGHYLGLEHTFVDDHMGEWPFIDRWERLGGRLRSDVGAVATGHRQIDLFVQGDNRGLWQRRGHLHGPASHWDSWISRGGELTSAPLAITHTAVSPTGHASTRSIHVFALGLNSALWHTTGPEDLNRAWEAWAQVADGVEFPVSAVGLRDQIHVFGRFSDGRLCHARKRHENLPWEVEFHAGEVVGQPSAVIPGNDSIEVFARRRQNRAAWAQTFAHHTPPGGWQDLGGEISSDPTTLATAHAVFLFARGMDRRLWYRWRPIRSPITTFEPWQLIGGPEGTSMIWATSSDDGNVHLLVHDDQNRLHHSYGNQNGWSQWLRVTHRWSIPALVSPYSGRVDVFDRGRDAEARQTVHKWFEDDRWSDFEIARRDAVAAGHADPANAFDGDDLQDTLPDPFAAGQWQCNADRRGMFIDGVFHRLDCNNIMSYYPNPDGISPEQIKIMRRILEIRAHSGTYPQP